MTELTQEQLRTIAEQAFNDVTLLLNQFPDARIAVIRGHDNFSYEAYTQDVFFDEGHARQEIAKIPRNGTGELSDTYHVITGTIRDLQEGRMVDERTGKLLDDLDIRMTYSSLQKRLLDFVEFEVQTNSIS